LTNGLKEERNFFDNQHLIKNKLKKKPVVREKKKVNQSKIRHENSRLSLPKEKKQKLQISEVIFSERDII
jgi:hypothetical protein